MEVVKIPFNKEEMTSPQLILNRAQIEILETELVRKPVFDHSFLIKLSKGVYSEKSVRFAFIQFSKHIQIFTSCLAALMCRAPTIRDRTVLYDNFQEEMGQGSLLGTHYMLYLKMLNSMGISAEEVDRTETMVSMMVLNDALESAVHRSFISGLAWLGLGGEYTIPNNFPYLAAAAKKTFAAIDTGFFERHGERDDGHHCDSNLLLAMHMKSTEDVALIRAEALKSLWLRASVWDELGAISQYR
jgi:pyrroloquinoline quinone (PQQ) biosynthesis protein C